jgi:arsenate reductase
MVELRLYPKLGSYVESRAGEPVGAPADRASSLNALASYIAGRATSSGGTAVVFVCTQNSRRSQLAQIWAQAAAAYRGAGGLLALSCGTEATAFYPGAVASLRRAGFRIAARTRGYNPIYEVRYSDRFPPVEAFSKACGPETIPQRDFCAVTTCSPADGNCPVVPGASLRLSIPYSDPNAFDRTDREAAAYDELCRQVCREMLYVLSRAVGRDG